MDSLAPEIVAPLLRGRPYRFLPSCPSTQRELSPEDEEGTVVATDHQTEGRGRLGRTWEAAPGTSLLFSVLLKPTLPPDRLPELTVAAARAIADVVGGDVKEPNDVLLGGRKVAGVLGEAREGVVVLGIGVNVNGAPSLATATSLAAERGAPVARAPLLAEILFALDDQLRDI